MARRLIRYGGKEHKISTSYYDSYISQCSIPGLSVNVKSCCMHLYHALDSGLFLVAVETVINYTTF